MLIKDAYHLSQSLPKPIEWLLEDLIPLFVAGDIFSPPDCGKSSLLLSLLIAITNKYPTWFGRKIAGGKVAIIGGEKSSDDVWTRDLHRSGEKVAEENAFTILEPDDFLWQWVNSRWERTTEWEKVIKHLRQIRPVVSVIDTIASAALGLDPMNHVQGTLLGKEIVDLQKEVGGAVLTVSHTSQFSQSLELHQRLDYMARSGGNGYPGWLRWLGALTTLTDNEKTKLGIDPAMRIVAFAVAKPSEMPVPKTGSKTNPVLFEYAVDGSFREINNHIPGLSNDIQNCSLLNNAVKTSKILNENPISTFTTKASQIKKEKPNGQQREYARQITENPFA